MTRPGAGRRLLPDERRGRDAGLLGGRLRGLPRAAARPAAVDGAGPHRVVRLLAEHRWPFRLHATYDESIARFLDVFEAVDRDVPLRRPALVLRPRRDRHRAEPRTHQGARAAASRSSTGWPSRASTSSTATAPRRPSGRPPIAKMLEMGIPVGAGTDATRVASYNPWVALYWLVAGKTVGGTAALPGGEPARPAGGAAALHARQRLVLGRGGEKGAIGRRPAGRPGRPLGRLLPGAGRGDQGHRVGADGGRREGRLRARARSPRCPAAAPGPAGLVPGRRVRRVWSTARCSQREAPGRPRPVDVGRVGGPRRRPGGIPICASFGERAVTARPFEGS